MGLFEIELFADRNQDDWSKIRNKVFRRDEYTCQRCFHRSGPYAGSEGRVLQAHHITHQSDGGEDSVENLVTLCKPCHGVQHPHNSVFDDVRGDALLFPHGKAQNEVSYVNSGVESEEVSHYIDRKNEGCVRCGVGGDTYLYPLMSSKLSEYTNPLEEYVSVCGSCLSVISVRDDWSVEWIEQHVIDVSNPYSNINLESIISTSSPAPFLSQFNHPLFQKSCSHATTPMERFLCYTELRKLYSILS